MRAGPDARAAHASADRSRKQILEFLVSLDCDVAQGFLLSRPLPPTSSQPALEAAADWETPDLVAPSLAGSLELTFDDGPDPVWTPAVLAALRGSPLRATFFVVATRVGEHPELVAAVRAAGHSVELHCYSHLRHTEADRATIEHDTERALAVLRGAGIEPQRWRTPDGLIAPWTPEIAAAHRLELCGWDVDTNDQRGHRAERMLAEAGPSLRPGAVVLLHDGLGPGDQRDGCEETVRFARLIAAEATAT